MHVFTVFAHPNRDSLAGAILDRFVGGLEAGGHSVDISDLYREDFDPLFRLQDFDYFRERGPMPAVIQDIHARIDVADVLAFVYPVWWWSVPAILKGWFERVLINGFAWDWDGDDIVPCLTGKRVITLCVSGSSQRTYDRYGYADALKLQIDTGIWTYCGLTDVETNLMTDVDASPQARERHLARAEEIGRELQH